jgi:hypothetical protein
MLLSGAKHSTVFGFIDKPKTKKFEL